MRYVARNPLTSLERFVNKCNIYVKHTLAIAQPRQDVGQQSVGLARARVATSDYLLIIFRRRSMCRLRKI